MSIRVRLVALLFLGCAGPALAQSTQTEDAGTSPVIRGIGVKRTVFCNRGRVTVHGSRNEVVMHGPCERVAIDGTDHRIAIEEVGSLSVSGTGHDVQWVRGVDGKEPKIVNHGTEGSVRRISPEDFAKIPSPTARE